MPTSKSDRSKDKFSSKVFETGVSQGSASSDSKQNGSAIAMNSKSVVEKLETKQINSFIENSNETGELIKVEADSSNKKPNKSAFQKLKSKTAAALVGSAVMLPILAVGTATYYFGSQAVSKQTILAKRSNNIALVETELARQQQLLAALLIGTGTTALLAGAISASIAKRLFDSMSKTSKSEIIDEADTLVYEESIDNLSKSVPQKDILKAIVEEARTYLDCDRVLVYSLNQSKYGTIVAESVALGYTKWLGITIQDPCFEAKYFDKYRDGRVRAINDLNKVKMTPCYKEQLEAMEVKANLVTPIVYEGKLFGLLVAHQCDRAREWQLGEIEYLHQIAKKTGLTLKNAQLLDDMVRLQTQAERERQWTNYFTDAIGYIRASIKQDDVLDISV